MVSRDVIDRSVERNLIADRGIQFVLCTARHQHNSGVTESQAKFERGQHSSYIDI